VLIFPWSLHQSFEKNMNPCYTTAHQFTESMYVSCLLLDKTQRRVIDVMHIVIFDFPIY
jgi:hypothetical protein